MNCGPTNYHKMIHYHLDRFQELYHRNNALKDVCKLMYAQMVLESGSMQSEHIDPCSGIMPSVSPLMPAHYPTLTGSVYSEIAVPVRLRRHGMFNPLGLEGYPSWPPLRRANGGFHDDMGVLEPRAGRRLLNWDSDNKLLNGVNVSKKMMDV